MFIATCGLYSSCSPWASQCSSFSCCTAQALGSRHGAAVVLTHELCSCSSQAEGTGSVAVAHGLGCSSDPLDQGLNPRLLHWQADSLPLSRQRGPGVCFNTLRLSESNPTLCWEAETWRPVPDAAAPEQQVHMAHSGVTRVCLCTSTALSHPQDTKWSLSVCPSVSPTGCASLGPSDVDLFSFVSLAPCMVPETR